LPPQTSDQLSNSLDIPHRITKMILNILLDAHLIHETKTIDEKSFGYSPALSTDTLSVGYCVETIHNAGINSLDIGNIEEFQNITKVFDSWNVKEDVLLKRV